MLVNVFGIFANMFGDFGVQFAVFWGWTVFQRRVAPVVTSSKCTKLQFKLLSTNRLTKHSLACALPRGVKVISFRDLS